MTDNEIKRAFVLGRIEHILRTADPQGPDQFFQEFFENIQTTRLDMLAHFFGQFHPDDFRALHHYDCELVEKWLLFRCGVSDGNPEMTIPQQLTGSAQAVTS